MEDHAIVGKYLEQFFDEVTPLEFYDEIFPAGLLTTEISEKDLRYHGIIVDLHPDAEHDVRSYILEDKQALKDAIEDHRECVCAPCVYWGGKRKNDNARYLTALTMDWDGITDEKYLRNFFHQAEHGLFEMPTFLVSSGSGAHIYWVLKDPVPCFMSNRKELVELHRIMTKKIWTQYLTAAEKVQYESPFQGFRCVGTATKRGGIVRAFRVGDRVSYEDVARSFGYEPQRKDPSRLIRARLKYGEEWFEKRIIQKKPRGHYVCNRAVYDSWVRKVPEVARFGTRYKCILAAVVFAVKCNIPLEEVKADCYKLVPILDALCEESFSYEDADAALSSYGENLRYWRREWLSDKTGYEFKPQRRNGRRQEDHLVLARTAKALHKKDGTMKHPEGRPSREEEIFHWRLDHPQGTKTQCCRDLHADPHTVRRWWDSAPRLADKAKRGEEGFDWDLLSPPMRETFLSLTPEERGMWIKENIDFLYKMAYKAQRREASEGKGAGK